MATCSFNVDGRLPGNSVSELTLSQRDQTVLLQLTFDGRQFQLFDRRNDVDAPTLLTTKWQPTPGAAQIRLWLSPTQSCLDVNGARLGLGEGSQLSGRPSLQFRPGAGITSSEAPRLQRLAPIAFQDDFARLEASAEDSLWESIAGTFMVNISRNPGSSQSAFQLWAAAPEITGIALAKESFWFWQNLRCGISVLPEDIEAEWGIVFCWLDQENHHLFSVAHYNGQGMAKLIRVRAGQQQVLAETSISVPRKAWQRADIIAVNGKLQAFLGGKKILSAEDPQATAGRIGLYLSHTQQAFFDDITVNSATDAELSQPLEAPFGPCEQQWSDFSGKHFLTDQHMTQWAHPRSSWKEDANGLFWFRNRLFHQLELSWTAPRRWRWPKQAQIVLFAEENQADTGYSFEFDQTTVTLKKNTKQLQTAPLPKQVNELTASVSASGLLSLTVNGEECLAWQDKEPLTRGWLAASLGRTSGMTASQLRSPDWRDQALVKSTHRLDYSFEHAPSAWSPQAGTWQGTHRWACVPKWSFFAGRGQSGPAESQHGNAILWNLRQIQGDFDLELFMAPMEGTPQRAHFSFPITLNVAFGGDGQNLDSGYNLVFGTYDLPSQLYFRERLLATNTDRVLPGIRLREGPWYHRMTQTWQHLRIQRRDGRILAQAATHADNADYQGLQPLFDLPADEQDPGQPGQFAVWTWGDNGLAIARATLSFQDSPGAAAHPTQPPARRGMTATNASEPRRYVRYQNTMPGGHFVTATHAYPVPVAETPLINLLWRAAPNTHLSLLATVNDQCAEWILTGPSATREYTVAMPAVESQPHPDYPGWQTSLIDLRELASFFPDQPSLTVDQLTIASPYEQLSEIAGIGVNRLGDWFDLAWFKIEPTSEDSTVAAAAPDWQLTVHGRHFQDDFEGSYGHWQRLGGPDGAALLLDATQPATGSRALRLLNQRISGTAGAWITRQPFRLEAFPALSFKARIPAGMEANLVVTANQKTFEIKVTGADSTWPLIGAASGFQQDGTWQTVSLPWSDWLRQRLGSGPIVIEELALADTQRMSSYQRRSIWIDDFQLVPSVAPGTVMNLVSSRAEQPIVAYQLVADSQPDTSTDGQEAQTGAMIDCGKLPGEAEWLHVTPHFDNGLIGRTRHLRISRAESVASDLPAPKLADTSQAPSAPYISYLPSDRLCFNDFEVPEGRSEALADYGDFAIRREAWVLRTDGVAATGNSSAQLVNLDQSGFYSIYFHRGSWDLQRWPCIAFDYRFIQPECNLNLTLLVNDAMTVVEWTGPNGVNNHFYAGIVGKTPYAKQDGQWHHTSFDLLEMMRQTRFEGTSLPVSLQASELATWATRHYGSGYQNPTDARLFLDNFTIYSERGRDPEFTWKVPGESTKISGYSVLFDQKADSVPPETVTHQENKATYADVAPGEWFLHVRAVSDTGAWGPPGVRQIVIKE